MATETRASSDPQPGIMWTPATLYSSRAGELRCDLCPHRCRLRDGQVGYCRVRRRTGDGLETATFATTVEHLDPVERKPLYHWRPGARALTFAAPGCSFRCDYCVNYRLSQFGRDGGDAWTARQAEPEAMVERAVAANAVVALSYTEPSLAIELTLALAAAAAPHRTPVIWKSNGFLTPEATAVAAEAVVAVNVDVKAADNAAHRQLTGATLTPVLRTIEALRAGGVWVEVATPLIPGTSDQPHQLAAIAASLASIDPAMPWHLLRFSPTFRMVHEDPSLPVALAAAVEIGRTAGLRYVYVERAVGAEGRNTRCPGCSAVVVERGIWSTDAVHLNAGACRSCGTRIDGIWETV